MARRSLRASDERLAASVVDVPVRKDSGRKYRCSTCGLTYPVEDLNPERDEEGRRVGWICDTCY